MNNRSFNPEATGAARMSTGELRCINLNGKEVAYTLKRCKRRTIGMRIDSRGLTVRIPSRESLRRVVRAWNPPLGAWVADATQSPG